MFRGLKSKLSDMATIKLLCEKAEAHALEDQQREPGAEHFLLAALDLPDGTARLAFEQAGAEPDALKAAIERQYATALRSIGLEPIALADAPISANAGIYQAAPSGQTVMQGLTASRTGHGPLLGAHVVGIVAGLSHGVAARALRALDVDSALLKSKADAIATSGHARRPSE